MKFKELKYKNFLSYGNNVTTFNFDSKILIIGGKNGSGKSSILDALYFVLTGKTYRNTTKTKLVNTFNKKDCLVELTFDVGNDLYLIKRGIKPNLFEIHKNNTLLPEDSSVLDYQTRLEAITGLTTKIIEQILIISNRFYKPFLELSASEKRNFTETIFDIDVLSDIAANLKYRLASVKETELSLNKDLERIKSNVELLKSNDSKLVDVDVVNNQIELCELKIEENEKVIEQLVEKQGLLVESKKELKVQSGKYETALEKRFTCNNNIKSINSNLNKLTDVCPTCNQKIKDFNKEEKEKELQDELFVWQDRLVKVDGILEKLKVYKDQLSEVETEYNKIGNSKHTLETDNRMLLGKIGDYKKQIEKQNQIDKDVDVKIAKYKKEYKATSKKRDQVTKEKGSIVTLQKLLSEKGLRKYIFNKHIAILNNHVNDNLRMLSASYQIKFDDEFNETIVAGGYNDLNYGNLSAGEKQRLDLALMFAFLEIARMKNNVNTNLLACDEMFSDIDFEGMEGIKNLFGKLKNDDNCVLVITHDDRIKELGDETYFVTKNKFSKITRE